jgi:prophage regulatory protein
MPVLVSVNDACKITSLSRTAIFKLREKGDFPVPVRLGEKRIAFVRDELDQWVEDRMSERACSRGQGIGGATDLYRAYSSDDTLLYVGISYDAISRLRQHGKAADWVEQVHRVTIERFETRERALAAERFAIQTERPLHNIIHNVDLERAQ